MSKRPKGYPATPELDKMRAAQDQSRTLGEFYDWLSAQRLVLAKYGLHDQLWPHNEQPEKLFARFFGIDLKKVEDERRAALEWQRRQNELQPRGEK